MKQNGECRRSKVYFVKARSQRIYLPDAHTVGKGSYFELRLMYALLCLLENLTTSEEQWILGAVLNNFRSANSQETQTKAAHMFAEIAGNCTLFARSGISRFPFENSSILAL